MVIIRPSTVGATVDTTNREVTLIISSQIGYALQVVLDLLLRLTEGAAKEELDRLFN